MALSAVLIFMLTAVALSPVTGQQQNSCAACNCPLDTDMDLDSYINVRINEIMGNEPRKLKHQDYFPRKSIVAKMKRHLESTRERKMINENSHSITVSITFFL